MFIELSSYAPLVPFSSFALFFVRIILGVIMMYYGWPKITNLKSNAADFDKMGFSPGYFWGTLVAVTEFFGSIALFLGFYVWLAAAAFAVEMIIGTAWKVTKTDKPFPDYSYDLLILALSIILLSFGSGAFSI